MHFSSIESIVSIVVEHRYYRIGIDTLPSLDCSWMRVLNKNFRFFEFLELFNNFHRGLTNYFSSKCCTGTSFNQLRSPRTLSIANEPHNHPSVFASRQSALSSLTNFNHTFLVTAFVLRNFCRNSDFLFPFLVDGIHFE